MAAATKNPSSTAGNGMVNNEYRFKKIEKIKKILLTASSWESFIINKQHNIINEYIEKDAGFK
ncbi:MAG: hypothetical protein ACRC1M_06200 [Methanobacteriaceae archaeon]